MHKEKRLEKSLQLIYISQNNGGFDTLLIYLVTILVLLAELVIHDRNRSVTVITREFQTKDN